jgi:LuxR family transcriptional regulator, transcriptional regulator of spore coat protein
MQHTAHAWLRQALTWLTLGLLTVNCQDHAQNPAAQPSCRVLTQVVNTESSTSKTGTTTQNTLNADRQLTRQVVLTTSTSGTTTTSSEQTNNYQYDASGFLTTLTVRQQQILTLIAAQQTTAQIAESLALSVPTVESHRRNLFRRLGVRSVAGLMTEAMWQGLIQ